MKKARQRGRAFLVFRVMRSATPGERCGRCGISVTLPVIGRETAVAIIPARCQLRCIMSDPGFGGNSFSAPGYLRSLDAPRFDQTETHFGSGIRYCKQGFGKTGYAGMPQWRTEWHVVFEVPAQ